MSGNGNGKVRFGDFTLDPTKRIVWHLDQPVDLPLKSIDLLCLLVERRGDVVTKDEIFARVWGDTFIEETNLTHNVYVLRKMFREYGGGDVIKTIPRCGYRFAGEVTASQGDSFVYERTTITDTFVEETTDNSSAADRNAISKRAIVVLAAAGVLFIVASGFVGWYLAVASDPKINSIAVIPFKTLNSNLASDHSGLGIADTLTTRLSSIKDLTVRPTSAVLPFAELNVIAVGNELGVDAVLEGSVYRANGQLKINARLVRTADSSVIWSGEFQKADTDELAVQNELALHVVDAITTNLRVEERDALLKNYTGSIDAFRLYERGRFEWNNRNSPSMVEAQRLFRNAIEKDPNFALAYSGLADTLATGGQWDEASAAATRALEIDPNLAEAHATDGFLKMFGHWEWDEAEWAFKKSFEFNPGNPTAHHWYATLLAIKGRNDEAKAEMQLALDINPLSFNYLADMGQLHYFAGDYVKAKEYCYRALALNPDFAFAHQYLYYIHVKTGKHDEAIEEVIKSDSLIGPSMQNAADRGKAAQSLIRYRTELRNGGLKGYLDFRYAGKPTQPDAFYFYAIKHAMLGENEIAIDYLERAAEAKTFMSAFAKADPVFENLRADLRYQEILKRMDLAN